MQNDDRPVGRLLTRRELMALFGASAPVAAMTHRVTAHAPDAAFALAAPDCVAQPRQTEGPYFVDEHLKRSDIRLDPSTGRTTAGAPFDLGLVVSQVTATGACARLPGAQVDIWHCDAAGVYSDVQDRSFDTMGQNSCAVTRSRMPMDVCGSRRSIPAGTPAVRCTFISRFACRRVPDAPTSSPHSSISPMN